MDTNLMTTATGHLDTAEVLKLVASLHARLATVRAAFADTHHVGGAGGGDYRIDVNGSRWRAALAALDIPCEPGRPGIVLIEDD